MKAFLVGMLILALSTGAIAAGAAWGPATEKELQIVIPSRAPVEKERIETEFRTASGISNGQGKVIAGVVLITAGYSAQGKYSHFFLTQVPIEIGGVTFKAGDYVFGSRRMDDGSLEVKFYEAATGTPVVTVIAKIETKKGPVRSLQIAPPENGKGFIKIGRFVFDYTLAAQS